MEKQIYLNCFCPYIESQCGPKMWTQLAFSVWEKKKKYTASCREFPSENGGLFIISQGQLVFSSKQLLLCC